MAAKSIILIKRPRKHEAHHGGAWKVAYADFVTAMMALFIVLWLLNTSQQVRDDVSGYFRDPAGIASKPGADKEGSRKDTAPLDMEQLKHELENRLKTLPDFEKLKNHIEITITPEGLRIELLEDERGTFFDLGSPEPNAAGRELLCSLAQYLGGVDNKLSIEGHTDSKPYSGRLEYSNWELSTDRANAARRLMRTMASAPTRSVRCAASPTRICVNRALPSIPPIAASLSSSFAPSPPIAPPKQWELPCNSAPPAPPLTPEPARVRAFLCPYPSNSIVDCRARQVFRSLTPPRSPEYNPRMVERAS